MHNAHICMTGKFCRIFDKWSPNILSKSGHRRQWNGHKNDNGSIHIWRMLMHLMFEISIESMPILLSFDCRRCPDLIGIQYFYFVYPDQMLTKNEINRMNWCFILNWRPEIYNTFYILIRMEFHSVFVISDALCNRNASIPRSYFYFHHLSRWRAIYLPFHFSLTYFNHSFSLFVFFLFLYTKYF